MRREFIRFIANDQGAAALEYGLIAAGIALAFLAAFIPFGEQLRTIADAVTAGLAEIVALSSR
jgi:pilus assembly protein Flp/PilA